MKSCRLGMSAAFFSLYVAFVGAAFLMRVHLAESGVAEIWGWDYQTFVGQIQDWWWIGYFGFRHPGLGLVCSPLVALEHVWSGAYLLVMPTTWILAGARRAFRLHSWRWWGASIGFLTKNALRRAGDSAPYHWPAARLRFLI